MKEAVDVEEYEDCIGGDTWGHPRHQETVKVCAGRGGTDGGGGHKRQLCTLELTPRWQDRPWLFGYNEHQQPLTAS